MPINVNLPIPTPGEEVEVILDFKDLPTYRSDYRFTGVELRHDEFGNIIFPVRYSTQPLTWSTRGVIPVSSHILR